MAQYGAPPQAGHAAAARSIKMKDHDGNQLPLAEHIRSILPSPIPNGVTEGIYQALFEMARLPDLPTGRWQEFHLHRAVEFLEKALDSLRCPEDPDLVEEGDRPSPCACCYAGEGVVGCWDQAFNLGFEKGYREAAEYLPRFRAGD